MSFIEKIDKNFAVPHTVKREGLKFYNVLDGHFGIYGVFYKDGCFRRMPEDIAKKVNCGVYGLHTHTAGGRVRFITDSPYVAIRAVMHNVCRMAHFAFTGSAGFDLYASENGEPEHFVSTFICPVDIKTGYESIVEPGDKKLRQITINMPLYSGVKELYIGLSEDAEIHIDRGYRDIKPFVYYGSSITQGGCACRPGNSYESRISRRFNTDYINLGFSGSARGEEEIADYIKKLPMSLFIYDYDYNAPSLAHLRATHERMYREVRKANPDLPIIILSRPNYNQDDYSRSCNEIIEKTYAGAVLAGDKNVYFIPGQELMSCGLSDCTVDNCHPNDLGFYSMAENLSRLIEKII